MSGARRRVTPAAGGVVWRTEGTNLLVAVVHRPRYDDWTLPKGKLHPDERPLLAAVREVHEEAGATVEVGRRLNPVEYSLGDAVKQVSYWAMRYLGGEHAVSDEVDRLSWATIAEATQRLSFPVDRAVLADFARLPSATRSLLLVRHARAGKRSDFHGDDRLRPLDKTGRQDARALVPMLAAFNPRRVLTADLVRCEQTVQPLADRLGLPLLEAPALSDEAFDKDRDRALAAIWALMAEPGSTVVCSQGHMLPELLGELLGAGPSSPVNLTGPVGHRSSQGQPYPSRKGSVWALSVADRGSWLEAARPDQPAAADYWPTVVAADYYPRPGG